MTSDELRKLADCMVLRGVPIDRALRDAADEIDRLTAENERLKESMVEMESAMKRIRQQIEHGRLSWFR